MNDFKFIGDWKFNYSLPVLTKLNFNKFYPPEYPHGVKSLEGVIPISFNSKRDNIPDPNEVQFNTLKWIQNNQKHILESLFNHVKNVLYPFYLSEIDFDEDWFPPLNKLSDLSNVLGIESIAIDTHSKNGISYAYYSFKFSVDDEHGIVIILHKTELIGFDQIGSIDDQKIIEDLGLDYSDYEAKRLEEYDKREFKFHSPHPKYGKLKPWQEAENSMYPYQLINKNRIEDFKTFVNNGEVSIDGNSIPFLPGAIMRENMELVEFCLSKKPKNLHGSFLSALDKNMFDIASRILNLGYNINEETGGSSILDSLIKKYIRSFSNPNEISKIEKRMNFLFLNKFNPYLQDSYRQNSFNSIRYLKDDVIKKSLLDLLQELIGNTNLEKIDVSEF